MFDIGWSEMMMIAIVAIVVIGPRQLPAALRTVGHWVSKARSMAREFQDSLDEMVEEAGLDDVRQIQKDVTSAASFDVNEELNKSLNPTGESWESYGEVRRGPPEEDPTEESESEKISSEPAAPPSESTSGG